MADKNKIEDDFSKLHAGIVFINDNRKRFKLAFRLISRLRGKWDYVA